MSIDHVLDIGREAVLMTLLLASPLVAASLLAGLCVSVLQALTQVQDQTLSFLPKIVALLLTLLYVLPWLLQEMRDYSRQLFHDIPLHLF